MSGLGYGAFNGNDGGLKGAMDAARQVMQTNENKYDAKMDECNNDNM